MILHSLYTDGEHKVYLEDVVGNDVFYKSTIGFVRMNVDLFLEKYRILK